MHVRVTRAALYTLAILTFLVMSVSLSRIVRHRPANLTPILIRLLKLQYVLSQPVVAVVVLLSRDPLS